MTRDAHSIHADPPAASPVALEARIHSERARELSRSSVIQQPPVSPETAIRETYRGWAGL